ncbi:protein Tho1p [Diutina catenulata]
MAEYSSQTVAQLKELLKERGLATDGKKADLVKRLEDADGAQPGEQPAAPAEAAPEPVAEAPAAEAPAEEANGAEQPAEPVAATEEAAPAEAEKPVEEKPAPKVLSPEERKSLAVDLLKKKIARAQKFGNEEGAEAARKDLARVEKFGVDPGTALAEEIGLVDKQLGSELRAGRDRKHKGKRGFKGK